MAISRLLEQHSLLVSEASTMAREVAGLLDPDRWPDAGVAARQARRYVAALLHHAALVADADPDGEAGRGDRLDAAAWMLDRQLMVDRLQSEQSDKERADRMASVMRATATTCRSAWRRRRAKPLELGEVEGGGFITQALIEALRHTLDEIAGDEYDAAEETNRVVVRAGDLLSAAAALYLLERDTESLAACAAARLCAQLPTPLYPGLLPTIAESLEASAEECAREAAPAPTWVEQKPPEPAAPGNATLPISSSSTTAGAPLALPRLGRFPIEAELGRGSMGVVYKGLHPSLNIPVAIKVVHEHSGNQTLRHRFEREASAIATLNHPGIVRLYDFDSDRDKLFMVTEYVSGRSLDSWLHEMGSLRLELALDIFQQVLAAVQAAHEQGVVHRDLKPQNILISGQGKVKVLDFGVAKLLDESPELTADGFTVGTPRYMPPEQLRGDPVDARADIYSLGVLLYEMLDGDAPFRGPASAIMHAHVFEPVPPSERIPDALMQVIGRAMAKNPNDRFNSCSEMAGEIRTLARSGMLVVPAAEEAPAPIDTEYVEAEPVLLERRCLRANCQSAGAWMCSYRDSEGRACETAWCAHHAVFVEDEPYCARHAAVVRALSTSASSNWAVRERPPVDDRSFALAASLREVLDPDVREMLRRRLQAAGAIQVVADGEVRRVNRDGSPAWEISWAALRERECLIRIDIRVDFGADAVLALVNEVPAFSAPPEWSSESEPGAQERFVARLVQALQVAADRPLVEPTRAFEVDQPNVDHALLRETALRLLLRAGPLPPHLISGELAIGPRLVAAELRGLADMEYVDEREGIVTLTRAGRRRAEELMKQRRYIGPMPVRLEEYRQVVEREAARTVSDEHLAEAVAGVELQPAALPVLQSALATGGPLLIYGPAGSGKTSLGRALAGVLEPVAVPVAIEAGGEVLRVFDPERHRLVGDQPADRRWRRIEAPLIETGAELTTELLEPHAGPDATWLPVQLLANGGVLLVDDLGRQRVPARQIVDRLAPLAERRHVNLLVGDAHRRVTLPFRALLVFATSMVPAEILTEFQLRHLPNKLPMHDLEPSAFERVFRGRLEEIGVGATTGAYERLHKLLAGRTARGAHAVALADAAADIARGRRAAAGSKGPAEIQPGQLEEAWRKLFATR
jgi:predicted Ser/Thr protein kinase/energy-coupling factor transporter ATP-binding protein EcfA2